MPDWNSDHQTTREFVLSAAKKNKGQSKNIALDSETSSFVSTHSLWISCWPRTVTVCLLAGQGVLLLVLDVLDLVR